MSVIANVLCTPNRLEMLLRAVGAEADGIGRQELIERLSPLALRPDAGDADDGRPGKPMAQDVLEEALRLRLVEVKQNRLFLTEPALTDRAQLRDWLEARLLSMPLSLTIEQRAFPSALAWFLAQDPMRPIPSDTKVPTESPRGMIAVQFGDDADLFELGSPQPFQQFMYWARYLGYATFIAPARGRTSYIPDPSEALARIIRRDFGRAERLPVRQFLERIALASPVLDTGATRLALEGLRPTDQRPDIEIDGLSRSLSFALTCLEEQGLLRVVLEADAPALAIVGPDFRRAVSHVVVGQTDA